MTDLKPEALRVNEDVEGRNCPEIALTRSDDGYSRSGEAVENHGVRARDNDDMRIEAELLKAFALAQDTLVTLNWQDDVLFPYETAMNDVVFIGKAIDALSAEKDTDKPLARIKNALNWIYRIDNNQNAFKLENEK